MKSLTVSTIPLNLRVSLVSVPVLSNAHMVILPPYGILYGSVQNIFFLCRKRSDVLTAMVRIIGNSGGTTVVMIRIQRKNNLFLSLSSF